MNQSLANPGASALLSNLRSWLLILAPAYWILVALIYNGTYWSSFGVNVLEFASVTDIATMSVLPISRSAMGMAFGLAIGAFASDIVEKPRRREVLIAVVAILGITLLFGIALGAALSLFLALGYLRSKNVLLIELLRNKSVRELVAVILLFVVPFQAYAEAEQSARRILSGSGVANVFWDGAEQGHRYLGVVGERLFLYDQNGGAIIIRNLDDADAIRIAFEGQMLGRRLPIEIIYDYFVSANDAQQHDATDN